MGAIRKSKTYLVLAISLLIIDQNNDLVIVYNGGFATWCSRLLHLVDEK